MDGWTEVYRILATRGPVATACAEPTDRTAHFDRGSRQCVLESPSESRFPYPEGHTLAQVQLRSDSLRSLNIPHPPLQTRMQTGFMLLIKMQ